MANFVLFLSLVCGIYAFMNWFVYWRIAGGLALSPSAERNLAILFLVFASCFLPGMFFIGFRWSYPVVFVGHLWLGVLAISFSVFLVQFLLLRFIPVHHKEITAACLLAAFALCAFSLLNGMRPATIKHVKVNPVNLPPELDGYRIVQLSDLHLWRMSRYEWVRRMVENVKGLDPDLVVITGDIIDHGVDEDKVVDLLRGLSARDGVFAVPGNHEYYAGIEKFFRITGRAGIDVLLNRSARIGDTLGVIGVDDREGRTVGDPAALLKREAEALGRGRYVVLLSHRPTHFETAAENGVDLQLSGHLHAGQIPPLDFIVWLFFRYSFGLYEYGSSFAYTTCGTGTWGPPMRLFSRSEIVSVELVARQQ